MAKMFVFLPMAKQAVEKPIRCREEILFSLKELFLVVFNSFLVRLRELKSTNGNPK